MYTGNTIPTETRVTHEIQRDIMVKARNGDSAEEILESFSVTFEELNDEEQAIFRKCFNFGRAYGRQQASEALLQQAMGKNGTGAALAILAHLSAKWSKEERAVEDGKFTFNIKV